MPPRPGEVYKSATSDHFFIVVSNEEFNRGDRFVAVPVTSQQYEVRAKLANCIAFAPGQFGFTTRCVAQAEGIMQVFSDEIDLQVGIVGRLDEAAMTDLIAAIGYVISAACFPT